MKKNLWIGIILCLLLFVKEGYAQELNAKVNINSDKITGTNKQVFTTLQTALMEFINSRSWTNTTFATNERIECTFNIIINKQADEVNFSAELQVSALRPVYNSTYVTNLLNYRDTQLEFSYVEGTPIEYVETNLQSNLVATLVFYIYVILGLDFDSFSPLGGDPYFIEAQQIASQAQSYGTFSGWTPFEKPNSRHGIISSLTDEALKDYRTFWYTYHRKGLDEMSANADRGRTTIINALSVLKTVREARPGTILLQMFADSKLSEVVKIYSKASSQEKKEGYDLLNSLYPTMTNTLEPMKK